MTYPSPSEPRPQAALAPTPADAGFDSSPPLLQDGEPRGSLSEGRCFSPARPSWDKRSFRSAAAARKFFRGLPGDVKASAPHQRPYLCPACGRWHLTSSKKRTLH